MRQRYEHVFKIADIELDSLWKSANVDPFLTAPAHQDGRFPVCYGHLLPLRQCDSKCPSIAASRFRSYQRPRLRLLGKSLSNPLWIYSM